MNAWNERVKCSPNKLQRTGINFLTNTTNKHVMILQLSRPEAKHKFLNINKQNEILCELHSSETPRKKRLIN